MLRTFQMPLVFCYVHNVFGFAHNVFRYLHNVFCYVHPVFRYVHNVFRYVHNVLRYFHNVFHYVHNVLRFVQNLFQPIYFIGEFPKVLHSAFQLKDKEIADVDTRLEANRFYFTMNNLLNHRLNFKCNDTAVLLRYPGETLHQEINSLYAHCWVIFHDFLSSAYFFQK